MSRLCAIAFSCVNILTLIFCTSMLCINYLGLTNGSFNRCSNNGYSSSLTLNIAMAVLSFLGLIGLGGRIRLFLRMYVGITIVFFLVVLATLHIGFYSMHTAEGRSAEYIKGDEFKLEHFSERAMKIFLNPEAWKTSKKCIKKEGFCEEYIDDLDDLSSSDLQLHHPLQGCCKPPKKCGYTQINETYWALPKTGRVAEDMDCLLYSNGPELCYNCDACKAAYVGVQVGDRFQLTVTTIFWFLYCISTLIMACSTLKAIEKSLKTEERARLNSTVTPL